MYYALLSVSVVLFGVQFLFNDKYEKEAGNNTASTFLFTFISSLSGLFSLLVINKFQIDATPFTLIMAFLTAANIIAYNFCSLKAIEHINLSLYSLFAMLGGMVLPFVTGIIFYDEPLTLGNTICLVLISIALALTVGKGNKKNKLATLYYAGVFVLNGMAGVLSKIYASGNYDKCNEAVYSIWAAFFGVLSAGIVLVILRRKLPKISKKAYLFGAGYGVINKFANYLLLIALAVLPASVQYPFVTGGVMIVSTIISLLCGQKPSKKELGAVALSFIGIMALVLIK